ncbi:MAG: hypothetical protein JSS68_02520 [Actinobacteria bacterium]|nr:hypothetical protein [Actinomycetota bacterium]MBS1885382.1 hypothetical protein [Actinomycetota bacterium]
MAGSQRDRVRAVPGSRGARSLVLAFLIAAALAVLAPNAAGACPSWAGVKGFEGHVAMSFTQSASGVDPGNGGTQTITLDRNASHLEVDLHGRLTSNGPGILKRVTQFLGRTSGGSVSVTDRLINTGLGQSGTASAGGPSDPWPAGLELWPRTCKYQLTAGFATRTTLSGDLPSQLEPEPLVSAAAFTPRETIPAHSLKLSGTATVDVYYERCPELNNLPGTEKDCYVPSGGWLNDFQTLKFCHSVTAENCEDGGEEQGTAQISWSISPVYGKKKKPHP